MRRRFTDMLGRDINWTQAQPIVYMASSHRRLKGRSERSRTFGRNSGKHMDHGVRVTTAQSNVSCGIAIVAIDIMRFHVMRVDVMPIDACRVFPSSRERERAIFAFTRGARQRVVSSQSAAFSFDA
jgi:hypothetical protein